MVVRYLYRVIAIGILLSSTSVYGAVSAQLSAQDIDELETVRLTIKVTETAESQALDLSVLEDDFQVINTSISSQSRFVNGRGRRWVDYQVILQPKRTGTLTIPSIKVRGGQTPTLELRVRPLSTQAKKVIDQLVFFENTISSNTIYVQSQLILTRRLFYSQGNVQLYSDLPGAPEITDAVVLTLGETTSGTAERNGSTYGVVQQQYAIFPEASGTFTVPAISITASVRITENNRISRKGVRVATDKEVITVLPVPATYPADQPWLPAEKVTLLDVVTPKQVEQNVGDTLTYELLAHIEGNIGSIVPPLPMLLDEGEFRIYPQAPTIQDDTRTSIVKGSRLQTHSIVPLKPGQLKLPATQLVWWDTVNKEVKTTTIAARTISVTGTAIANVPPQAEQEPNANEDLADPEQSTWLTSSNQNYVLLALGVTLIVLSLVFDWWTKRRSATPLSRTGPILGVSEKRHAYRELQNAFSALDARQIHAALGAYLAEFYNCQRHVALNHFSDKSPDLRNAIEHLNSYLYARKNPLDNHEVGLKADIKTIRAAINSLRTEPTDKANDPLPALY